MYMSSLVKELATVVTVKLKYTGSTSHHSQGRQLENHTDAITAKAASKTQAHGFFKLLRRNTKLKLPVAPVSLVKNIKKEKRKKDPPKTNKQTKPLKVRQCMLAALSNDLHCFVLIKISAFFFNRLSFLILFPNASRSSFVSGVARGFIEFEVPGLSFVLNWPARAGGVGGGGGGGSGGCIHCRRSREGTELGEPPGWLSRWETVQVVQWIICRYKLLTIIISFEDKR